MKWKIKKMFETTNQIIPLYHYPLITITSMIIPHPILPHGPTVHLKELHDFLPSLGPDEQTAVVPCFPWKNTWKKCGKHGTNLGNHGKSREKSQGFGVLVVKTYTDFGVPKKELVFSMEGSKLKKSIAVSDWFWFFVYLHYFVSMDGPCSVWLFFFRTSAFVSMQKSSGSMACWKIPQKVPWFSRWNVHE